MPVSRLLVEGKLDVEILAALFGGRPPVDMGGSKQSLAPRTLTERQGGNADVCYVRDRDFDYDPPDDTSQPVVDRMHARRVLGWRWCRHEIENYLIDPEWICSHDTGHMWEAISPHLSQRLYVKENQS